jgi:hypothetical protein
LDISSSQWPVVEVAWKGPESRKQVVTKLAAIRDAGQRCSVLWIADDLFEHYHPDELGGAKLGAISYFSDSFRVQSLRRLLRIVERTDYVLQQRLEEQILSMLGAGRRIIYDSPTYGATATFDYTGVDHWFSLHGPLGFGDQSVLPTGQFAALTDPSGEFSFDSPFLIDGQLVVHGAPLVHRGARSTSAAQLSRMYRAVDKMRRYAVILHVRAGLIYDMSSPNSGANPMLDAFARILASDARYRKIHEIGLGTNSACRPLARGNFFPNYRFPAINIGLGLGGHTPFHLDLMCSEVEMFCEMPRRGAVDVFRTLKLR